MPYLFKTGNTIPLSCSHTNFCKKRFTKPHNLCYNEKKYIFYRYWVDDCIKNGILSDFLSKNRAEAIAVSIFEYDEEKHMKSERKEWREIGRKEGLKAGFDIIKSLMDAGKYEEAKRALSDNDYREQLCQNYFSESK